MRYFRRYIILTSAQAIACALWTLLTHTIDAFDVAAYMRIFSAAMQSGKTNLLIAFSFVVFKARKRPKTLAALARKIEKNTALYCSTKLTRRWRATNSLLMRCVAFSMTASTGAAQLQFASVRAPPRMRETLACLVPKHSLASELVCPTRLLTAQSPFN